MNTRSATNVFFLIFSVLLFSFNKESGVTERNYILPKPAIAGDTSFAANAAGGWSALSSYLKSDSTDSVDFEMILNHTDDAVDWDSEQLIGRITNPDFLPGKEITAEYQLLPENVWNVRITAEGKTYIKILNGAGPSENPIIIPFKVRFGTKE